MAFQQVRILHVSDLHDRGERESEAWRRRRVLGEAWEENLAEILQDGPIDLVCFTGDAADWGKPAEFAAAGRFLHALCERVNVTRDRLFVVPGNHDLDRSLGAAAWRSVREAASRADALDLARWLHKRGLPPGFEEPWRDLLFARFEAYRQWLAGTLGRPELLAGFEAGGPHAYRVSLEIRGLPVHVIGLDSAWLCGDDADAGTLRITDEQVMAQLSEGGKALGGLRLVLVHHPLDELHSGDREVVRSHLANHADLVLRGHLHSPQVSSGTNGELRQLAAGCLYEGHRADQHPNGCQVLTLERGDDGGVAAAEVRLRSFSPRGGHWHDDGSLHREASGGRLRFLLRSGSKRPAATGANPFDPFHTVLPPLFVGRESDLRRLEASLTDRNGTSIVGDWRIGKSSLLRAWEQKARALGRVVVFVDGQGAEGASIEALVGKVLGRPAPGSADAAADALATWAATQPVGLEPVMLIDELDGLVPRIDPRFFERLRQLLDRLVLAVATRRPVDLLYRELGLASPFHNRLKVLQLGLLDAAAAEILLAQGTELDAEDKALVRRWAGRHPFHVQLLGHCLIQAKRFGETRQQALDHYQDTAFARLRELWARLEEKEQQALRQVAQGQPTEQRSLRRRGLVDEAGNFFGEVLRAWLLEGP